MARRFEGHLGPIFYMGTPELGRVYFKRVGNVSVATSLECERILCSMSTFFMTTCGTHKFMMLRHRIALKNLDILHKIRTHSY
jgi:hypothetical protein